MSSKGACPPKGQTPFQAKPNEPAIMNRFPLLLAICLGLTSPARGVDYVEDVLPILETYCLGCHTQDDAQGGLVMESHAALMTGGDSGLAITPGVASSSRLFMLAAGKLEPVMPPDDLEGPTPEELEILAAWIDDGAKGPNGDMPLKRTLRTPDVPTSAEVTLPITAIAISPDGKQFAKAHFGKIEIRDEAGKPISKIQVDAGKVNSLAFDATGKRILAATGLTGGYGQAVLYDIASGQLIRELVGHRDVLYAAEFSPDGTKIATAGYDQTIVIWNAESGDPINTLQGHNGAIFDLSFSPDGRHLISACADETAKVWDTETGKRMDTLSQPEGEVYAVRFTHDGKFLLAGSADNRLRVWRFVSTDRPRINPIVQTRFVDESPVVHFDLTNDGRGLVIVSEAGNVKLLRTDDWSVVAAMASVPDAATDLVVAHDGSSVSISLMNGEIVQRTLPAIPGREQHPRATTIQPIYLDVGPLAMMEESKRQTVDEIIDVPRGVEVQGVIAQPGETDQYRFTAKRGEVWAIDADKTSGDLDPKIQVRDDSGELVLRTRLQAVRDTYFTFRGKNSTQTDDFRLFGWQEIGLDQYLYSNGEVTKTWMHPRGPDSGFDVYPGEGHRYTYFGTTHTTHALGEPAYVVRELAPDEAREPNGLPVFDVYYENDDDPARKAGNSSRLLFTAPQDGRFTVSVADTRGHSGADYGYKFRVRPADPSFTVSVMRVEPEIHSGTGREVRVVAERIDGFDGPIEVSIGELPEGWKSTFPLTIEANQKAALGMIWVPEGTSPVTDPTDVLVTASAEIVGRTVERDAGMITGLKVGSTPKVIPIIQPIDQDVPEGENWTIEVPRGETVPARVVLKRSEGFDGEVRFGNEDACLNAPHGVYVDNIGLSGLLVLPGADEQVFFLTADPVAAPGERTIFLKTNQDKGTTSLPVTVRVK